MEKKEYLRRLSSVDDILQLPAVQALIKSYPRGVVVETIRAVVDELRQRILSCTDLSKLDKHELDPEYLVPRIAQLAKRTMSPRLKRVINTTGVVIHTNLGRSILSKAATEAVAEAARYYSNLEFDLGKGQRGSRHSHIEDILCSITGAESGMVVNNNASAVLLALTAVAQGREVVVSRGELVEIGGSFRIPDVMRQSGAILKEVGTTNKTHLIDYEKAITPETGLLLKVHTSNFKIMGFTAEVSLEDMVKLARGHNLEVMHDLGSGVLIDLSQHGLVHEPTIQDSVKAGVDIITFSGDKLLGGPQGGIIIGKSQLVDRMKKHPLARALRVDKMTLAGLEATLRLYLDPEKAIREIPTLAMILATDAELLKKAKTLAAKLKKDAGDYQIDVEKDISMVGGGALPIEQLPTRVVSVSAEKLSTAELERRLRESTPPVVVRVKEDKILLDVRTILPEDFDELVAALGKISRGTAKEKKD
jgi:L-seryl-tRNA(Ser) seleniumtransferase